MRGTAIHPDTQCATARGEKFDLDWLLDLDCGGCQPPRTLGCILRRKNKTSVGSGGEHGTPLVGIVAVCGNWRRLDDCRNFRCKNWTTDMPVDQGTRGPLDLCNR